MAWVFLGTLGVVPLAGWIAHQVWPGFLGRDPNTAFTAYYVGALLGWVGMALLK